MGLISKDKDQETKQFFDNGWVPLSVEDVLKATYTPKSQETYHLFRKFLSVNGKILEAGSGLCNMVIFLKKEGYEVYGLDYLEGPLKKANTYDNSLYLTVGDIQALPYSDAAFKTYLSFGVLEHLEKGPLKALKEANRVLVPGGTIVVTVPYPNILTRLSIGNIETPISKLERNRLLRRIFNKKEQRFYKPPYVTVFSKIEIRLLFEQTGFDLIAIYPTNHSYNLYSLFSFFRENELGIETKLCLQITNFIKRIVPWKTCLLSLSIGRKIRDL